MKKVLLMFALLLGTMGAKADNVTVADATVKQGGTGTFQMALNLTTDEYYYRGCQFDIILPEGLSIPRSTKDTTSPQATSLQEDYTAAGSYPENQTVRIVYSTMIDYPMTAGLFVELPIEASTDVEIGDVLEVKVTNIQFSDYQEATNSTNTIAYDDVTFNVTVVGYDVLLDENSTVAPVAAEGVDVLVKRTINADEWSTIVLPFAMDEEQVKAAFGDDAEIADFTAWESTEDDEGDIVAINADFSAVNEIEANHPYLIKVSSDVEEFTASDVSIDPESEPSVQVGKRKAERGFFNGTYVAETTVPENNLFLSGNKFWYSIGNTKIKAFRGYFEFADVLTDVENGDYAKVRFSINGENATGIAGLEKATQTLDGVYTVNGQFVGNDVQMNRLPKGVYIVNGKKYFNK